MKPDSEPKSIREQPEISAQDTINFLTKLRDEHSDEIPDEIVHGRSGGHENLLKCQRTWFYSVMLPIGMAIKHLEFHGKQVPAELTTFERDFVGEKWHPERVSREEIDFGNKVINIAISELENLKHSA